MKFTLAISALLGLATGQELFLEEEPLMNMEKVEQLSCGSVYSNGAVFNLKPFDTAT